MVVDSGMYAEHKQTMNYSSVKWQRMLTAAYYYEFQPDSHDHNTVLRCFDNVKLYLLEIQR